MSSCLAKLCGNLIGQSCKKLFDFKILLNKDSGFFFLVGSLNESEENNCPLKQIWKDSNYSK